MNHRIYYDDENEVGIVEVVGEYTVQNADETFDVLEELFKGKNKERYYLLVDLREAIQTLNGATRKRLQTRGDELDIKRIAMVVTNPAPRMIGKMVVSVMGKSDSTSFFKTKAEALVWLQEKE